MKKVFWQKVGIAVVTIVSIALLVWAMFIPESNKWWNTYLVSLIFSFAYFLVKFWRDRWEDDFGSVLNKISIVGMFAGILGPAVQMLGLHFYGITLTGASVLPCEFGIAWMFMLLLSLLIATYLDSKQENHPLINWTILFAICWLFSTEVCFAEDVMKLFGCEMAEWVKTVFSVVYPITFLGTVILILCCIFRSIFTKK